MSLDLEKSQQHVQQEIETFADPEIGYPANHFAFIPVRERFSLGGVSSLVEVGVGHGNAIPVFTAEGIRMSGFDIKPELVVESRERAQEFGQDPHSFIEADIEIPDSYIDLVGAGEFDALVAMGVLPHVKNTDAVLLNMSGLVRPGGHVAIEFRNSLFSLFTFNRYTREFIIDDLLNGVSSASREIMDKALAERIDVTKPGPATSAFHNPFEVEKVFQRLGFLDIEIIPFHYHAFMPSQESIDPQEFRMQSMALESEESGWRGLFLCSAFLVYARTPSS